jgi:hypothetical protein
MATQKLCTEIDLISERLWDISLDKQSFEILRQKVKLLSKQIAVHHTLELTASQLLAPQPSLAAVHESRLSKFMDTVYGDSVDTSDERWSKLRSVDCQTFLYIAISYTPLEVSKMHREEFKYLLECTSRYLRSKIVPPRWLFSRGIQMTLAGRAHISSTTNLRKGSSFDTIPKSKQLNRTLSLSCS